MYHTPDKRPHSVLRFSPKILFLNFVQSIVLFAQKPKTLNTRKGFSRVLVIFPFFSAMFGKTGFNFVRVTD